MKNISIQLPEETRRQIAKLAAWWGESPQRHNTPVIARCVERTYAAETLERDGYDTTVVSRKSLDSEVSPEIVTIEGRPHVALGSGLFADIAAMTIDAGSVPGEYTRIGDDVYYYLEDAAPDYGQLLAIVMLRVK